MPQTVYIASGLLVESAENQERNYEQVFNRQNLNESLET